MGLTHGAYPDFSERRTGFQGIILCFKCVTFCTYIVADIDIRKNLINTFFFEIKAFIDAKKRGIASIIKEDITFLSGSNEAVSILHPAPGSKLSNFRCRITKQEKFRFFSLLFSFKVDGWCLIRFFFVTQFQVYPWYTKQDKHNPIFEQPD